MTSTIDRILELSGPLPNAARHRKWLEGQKKAALDARWQQLESEHEKNSGLHLPRPQQAPPAFIAAALAKQG